jgi:hypothetical protein
MRCPLLKYADSMTALSFVNMYMGIKENKSGAGLCDADGRYRTGQAESGDDTILACMGSHHTKGSRR